MIIFEPLELVSHEIKTITNQVNQSRGKIQQELKAASLINLKKERRVSF